MDKSIVYYTDNLIYDPIKSVVIEQIKKAFLPVVSVSLRPIEFGKNIVLYEDPKYVTMLRQIHAGLTEADTKYVFFCEHDCLYPVSHFDFTPDKDNIFYYNSHVYRWDYPKDRLITYDRLISLSGLCVNRQFALEHYTSRLETIISYGYENDIRHEPEWARKWGYEPGTKKRKRGGFSDDDYEVFYSDKPIIDIRHRKTFSPPKVTLDSFKHKPSNWKEIGIKDCGWDLKGIFKL